MLYSIGDIHGQCELLRDSLDRIRRHAAARSVENPEVILVGDLVDRGPDSRGVVELAMGGFPGIRLLTLSGNHEEWMTNALNARSDPLHWLHSGGAETVESYGVAIKGRNFLENFCSAVPDSHREWLASLPLMVRRGRNLFVHAGVTY